VLERETSRIDLSPAVIKSQLRAFLSDWEGLLIANVAGGADGARSRVTARISFRYVLSDDGRDYFELTLPIAFDRVLTAAVPTLRGLQDLGQKMAPQRAREIRTNPEPEKRTSYRSSGRFGTLRKTAA
jgi:hypothetical protein